MRSQLIWPLSGLVLGLALAFPIYSIHFPDDVFIHARIAENLLQYGSPLFNVGEKFKADSSTGYVFLLAALARVCSVETAIRHLETFAIALTFSGLFYLAGISEHRRSRNLISVVSVIPFLLLAAYAGMETPIVCALMTAVAIAWRRGRRSVALLLLCVAACFRFEVILLVFLALLYCVLTGNFKKSMVLCLAALTLFFSLELFEFGSIIPHAAKAKIIGYGLPIARSALGALEFGHAPWGVVLGLLAISTFLLRAAQLIITRRGPEFGDIFLLFSAGVLASWMMGRTLIFPWYYCLFVFPLGIWFLLSGVEPSTSEKTSTRILRAVSLTMLVGFGAVGAKAAEGILHSPGNLRVVRYKEIGAGLYAACPRCQLVTSEIGGIGYTFRGTVHDAFGIGDPEALQFHPLKVPEERRDYAIGAIPPRYVLFRNPDFVVSMPVFAYALMRSDVPQSYFLYSCPLGTDIGSLWGDSDILLLSKHLLAEATTTAIRCSLRNPPARED